MWDKIRGMVRNGLCVLVIIACFWGLTESVQAKSEKNMAWSVEYFTTWWYYDGTLQFVPSYIVPQNPGYDDLTPGTQVKQGYINYIRGKDEKSVIGGRKYTRKATNKKSNLVYSVTATAKDSLNIFFDKTKFRYGFFEF